MTISKAELKFPNVSTVLSKIRELKSLDLQAIDFDELKGIIDTAFINVLAVKATIPAGSLLYRARLFPQSSGPYTKISEIGIPPKDVIRTFGRANKPHEPTFYASSNIELSMNEVCRITNDDTNEYHVCFAVIGEWRVKSGNDILVSNLCYNLKAQEFRGDLKEAKSIIETMLNNKPNGKPALPQKAIIGTSMLLEFFSDEYAKEVIRTPDDYKISAAYMDLLMDYSRDIIQGINYPSVATNFAGDNIVLTRNCFENKLDLNQAFVVTAGFYTHDAKLNMSILLRSKTIKGNEITWEELRTPR